MLFYNKLSVRDSIHGIMNLNLFTCYYEIVRI